MIYREYLVMRKALAWYASIVVVLAVITALMPPKGVTKLYYGDVAITAGAFAAAFGWIFGVALGNGSRQAARILWVLPAERWKIALQLIAVDLIGTTIAFAFAYLVELAPLATSGAKVQFLGTVSPADIFLTLGLAYATYGWSTIIGMVGRRVAYFGIIAAPALAIWLTVAESSAPIAQILRAPIVANPFAVFNMRLAMNASAQFHSAFDRVTVSLQWLGTSWETPALFAIAAATCALAVVLWQRAQLIS